ncbi:hypothetical protein Hhel01_01732 [Haloferula helveola]
MDRELQLAPEPQHSNGPTLRGELKLAVHSKTNVSLLDRGTPSIA